MVVHSRDESSGPRDDCGVEVKKLLRFVGEVTIGPSKNIVFNSRPLAPPRSTVSIAWGPVVLVVRVYERSEGMAYGRILRTIPCVPAS